MPKRYDQDPANKAIVDALKAQKKDPSGPYVWITYAAVQSLATALDRILYPPGGPGGGIIIWRPKTNRRRAT